MSGKLPWYIKYKDKKFRFNKYWVLYHLTIGFIKGIFNGI